jgi:hypothetical protein
VCDCVCLFVYIYIYFFLNFLFTPLDIYMLPFQTENGSPGTVLESVFRLLIVQTEVDCLSVC